MSDNINYNTLTGKDAYYSVKERAWHYKGQISQTYQQSGEVIVEAQIAYRVGKFPNSHHLPSGRIITSENSFYTARLDTEDILGDKLGADYTVIQNVDAFTFFDNIAGKEDIKYETAGALGNGYG